MLCVSLSSLSTQVDVTNVYGKDKEAENRLRSFQGGKLSMKVSACVSHAARTMRRANQKFCHN